MIKRIYLEITDICNLNCPFCTNEKGNSYMQLEDIKDYLDKIKGICDYIYLHVLGEPLLHPSFNEILELLDSKDFKLQLVTNGILLSKYPDILSHKSLRKLSISLHSINNLNIDEDYFKTINNLIEHNNNKTIELRLYDYDNLDDRLHAYLKNLQDKYDFEITKKNNSYKLKDNVYIYFEELFRWPDLKDEYISDRGKCLGAISQLAILHNGDVTTCCLDPKGINKIGSLKSKTLKDILDSQEYLDIINNYQKHLFTKELCKHCSYRLRFEKQ